MRVGHLRDGPTRGHSYAPQPSLELLIMSLLMKDGRISSKPFAAVPALLNVPAIIRSGSSVSNVSSFRGIGGGADLAEGCFVTKSIRYSHQLAHMLGAVRKRDPKPVVSRDIISVTSLNLFSLQEAVVDRLKIVPSYLGNFTLDSLCNLVYRKSVRKYIQ